MTSLLRDKENTSSFSFKKISFHSTWHHWWGSLRLAKAK